jgi:hypothetical protein
LLVCPSLLPIIASSSLWITHGKMA